MSADGAPLAVGVDGCRGGWVAAAALAGDGAVRRTELHLFTDVRALIEWRQGLHSRPPVGIDMPIGLPRTAGLRTCDREARRILGRRWMTVFAPPDRELLGLDFEAARDVVRARRRADPDGVHPIATRETINIAGKVAELDRLLGEDPSRARWLVEVHPELTFRVLAGRDLAPKRTALGAAARLRLLADWFPDAEQVIDGVGWVRSVVARDDLVDAYAALASALRFGSGRHLELGDGTRDERGLPVRIVA